MKKSFMPPLILSTTLIFLLSSCGKNKEAETTKTNNAANIQIAKIIKQQADGKAALRFETFGNEGFWTDVVRLPKGIIESKFTPAQALKLGLSFNAEALDEETKRTLSDELKAQGVKGPMMNNPDTMIKLLNANAVIGLVVKDVNGDGKRELENGDKAGVSCVLCHAVTDKSVFDFPTGGSIGTQIDGPAVHNIQMGKIFALAANTKGFYPMAQLRSAKGNSIGRAPSYAGMVNYLSEADFDAYFSNPNFYPAGTFDDTLDGHGNPIQNAPLFRQDLAAPYGSAGEMETFVQYANSFYTLMLDPSVLVTEGGRVFLNKIAGTAGDKIAREYLEVLEEIGVRKYSYIKASKTGEPGTPDTIVGIAVDQEVLLAMGAYVKSLRSPSGLVKDIASVEKGKTIFQDESNKCLNCHNADQSAPVKNIVIDMKTIFPGDTATIIGKRPVFNPMVNTAGRTFDDKMISMNASLRGLNRGAAIPLLMDLGSKKRFLHDASVDGLEKLFDSGRGSSAPHPFYIKSEDRKDLIAYLQSLDDNSK